MIQLYLLVLIIIFVFILVTIKEKFNSCSSDKVNVLDPDFNLYGCNTLDDENKPAIKLVWKKKLPDNINEIIIIGNTEDTEDNDSTFIIDGNKYIDNNDNFTYVIKDKIKEGYTYFFTINYIRNYEDLKTIETSHTLKIKAVRPVSHNSLGGNLQQQTLMNLLKNKTVDIHI